MNPILLIVCVASAIAAIYVISRIVSKREKNKCQKMKDMEIEHYMFKKGMSELVAHSDHNYLAFIISDRIAELMEYGVNPRKLHSILKKMGIETIIVGPITREELLRSKIQRMLLERIDQHNLKCWSINNKTQPEDWEKMNGTFFTKAKPNGFIMDLRLN